MGRLRRLPHYDYNQPGYYFLTFCTKGRACLLSRIVGRDDLGAPTAHVLLPAGRALDGFIRTIPAAYPNVTLCRYVIMPNHVHLLISIPEPGEGAPGSSRPTKQTAYSTGNAPRATALVPRIIAALKRFTNQAMGLDLWQDGYHDHVIRNEGDYLRIWRYIDTNPAKWAEDRYFSEV